MKKDPIQRIAKIAMMGIIACGGSLAYAQTVAPQSAAKPVTTANPAAAVEEETIVLSPFTVASSKDRGYQATSTLAGTQLRTDLAEVGSAISVLTKEFLTDVGAYNNQTVLAYALNTEVGGSRGNFSGSRVNGSEGHVTEPSNFNNPNANTRVRGLAAADNTRDYFLTDIPWDGYNVSRVDLLRGPNAILFGLGSPAGIINAGTNVASFHKSNVVEVMFDKFGTVRGNLDTNQVLIDNELGLRVSLLENNQKFQQRPAFRHDQRAFGALKYAPAFLNKNGTRFEVSGNAELGRIKSNNPRSIPPEDQISTFWKPISKGGINKHLGNVFTDMNRAAEGAYSATPQYAYNDVVYGEFGPGMMQYVNANGASQYASYQIPAFGARDSAGNVFTKNTGGNIGAYYGNQIYDQTVMRTTQQWASSASGGAALPYSGIGAYRNEMLTDPSAFDFYHSLIDGSNKEENNRWKSYSVDIQNTFLNDMVGYDLTAYKEHMDSSAWSALGWEGNALKMDVNGKSPSGGDNPNVGRAYVQARTAGGAYSNETDRAAYRAKVFGTYDFSKNHSGTWAKILGTQTITGVYSDEDSKADYRNMRLFDLDSSYRTKTAVSSKQNDSSAVNSDGLAGYRYYISSDLRSKNGIRDANFGNLSMPFINWAGGVTTIKRFDNTWTAPASVNPSAAWINPLDPTNRQNGSYTQSNNPANYKGWTNDTATLLTIKSNLIAPGTSVTAKDYLTDSATLTDSSVKSTVGVYQGTFWNNSIVGIYGTRLDRSRSYNYNTSYYNQFQNSDPLTGSADLRPSTYNYQNPQGASGFLETHTKNWSVMAHLNKLIPGWDPLPFNLRVYYNKGENFQPSAGRTDMFGQPLPPPGGTTTDKSVMISTKDDRFSMRVTKYETAIVNATSTDAEIGNLWALQQTLPWPGNEVRKYLRGDVDTSGYIGSGGDGNKLTNSIIPAWMKFEKDFRAKFPEFVNAWMGKDTRFGTDRLDGPDANAFRPAGSVFTEDSVSKGYEVEFTANPTRNWRMTVNASKTEATRDNVPGKGFREVAEFIDNAYQNTDVGLAPIWWPQNVAGVRGFGPYPWNYRPEWLKVQSLNGQSAGEIRKYRANAVTSYDFTSGALTGVGVGAGYRWQDKSVIGYAPILNKDGSLKINTAAPFYAPSESTVDLWLSYSRKLSHNIRWKIQLNVFNAGGKNELTPIAAGVDPEKALLLTNVGPNTVVPMKATSFAIREGMSWQISNRFEF